MSASSSVIAPLPAGSIRPDPSRLNGDVGLTSDDREAYLHFHRERNAHLAHLSRVERVRTLPMPCSVVEERSGSSPSRVAMDSFVRWFGAVALQRLARSEIRVLDLGCGSGYARRLLADAGLSGVYVGLDQAEHPRFGSFDCAAFAPRLIIGDVHALDLADVGPIDLLISMTALEHFEDDARALERARRMLAPGAGEVHIVPGEKGLDLWGPHGWRQYSPRCVRRLCPRAEIYRIGGFFSALLHEGMISHANCPQRERRQRFTGVYRRLRACSHHLDRWTGNRPASLYAAVVWPGGSRA
ncbi:MAG: methyltransferase domain-containing protein [Phycisphaerales bacterium]|nr:methyltransferase domain-containing protein [Phycisphaerales bacterium]